MVLEVYVVRVKEERDASVEVRKKRRMQILESKVKDRIDRESKPIIPLPSIFYNWLKSTYDLIDRPRENLETLNNFSYAC